MINKLARVTILVRDQDEALRFYTEVLGLEVREDWAAPSHFPNIRELCIMQI